MCTCLLFAALGPSVASGFKLKSLETWSAIWTLYGHRQRNRNLLMMNGKSMRYFTRLSAWVKVLRTSWYLKTLITNTVTFLSGKEQSGNKPTREFTWLKLSRLWWIGVLVRWRRRWLDSRGGGTPTNFGWGVPRRFVNPNPILRSKKANTDTLF